MEEVVEVLDEADEEDLEEDMQKALEANVSVQIVTIENLIN
jgi:hypothetical protein